MPTGPGRTSFRELQAELLELAERSADPSPAFAVIGDDFRQEQAANFQRGGRPKWKPLSPAYAAFKASGRSKKQSFAGYSRTTSATSTAVGVFSGGLRDSLTKKNDPYHIDRITRTKDFVIGSANPVSHLFGGKHKTRNQPKRKPFVLTPTMRRYYLQVMQDFLAEGRLR